MRWLKLVTLISLVFLLMLPVFIFILGRTGAGIPVLARLTGTGSDNALIYARARDSETLDPALALHEESYKVIANIFEGLVRFKPGTTEVEPCLAKSWRISPDAREWTFYLRRDVKFHDGTPFNAEAVRFSIERQMPPYRQNNTPYAAFTFGMVETIDVPDPYTVKFVLKYPYAPFLRNLAMPASAPIVSPTAATTLGDDFGDRPVGTGPYRFDHWEKDKYITLKAYQDYWGDPAEIQSLTFKVIKNNRFRSLALKLGWADIIDGLTTTDIRFLEGKGCAVLERPGQDLNYLGFFTDKKPFDDPEIRRAVSMAVDRRQIVDGFFQGAVFEANGPLPPGVMGYDPDLNNFPYDPEGAKKILADNGYPHGLKITMLTYEDSRPYNPSGGEKLAARLQADLARVGIEVAVKVYPWHQYKEALLNKEGNAFLYGWISDNGDPDNFLYTLLSSSQIENGLNSARYRNQEVDLLLARAQQETEPLLREQMYRRAIAIICRDAPWIFLNHSKKLAATVPEIKGFQINADGTSLFNTVIKRK